MVIDVILTSGSISKKKYDWAMFWGMFYIYQVSQLAMLTLKQ
jgi:hypothetical protein